MSKVNIQFCSYGRLHSVGSIKEQFCGDIALRSEPFSFHYFPEGLHNIQMRGVWWDVEKKESPFLSYGSHPLYFLITMYTGIVKHGKYLPAEFERESIKKFNHVLGIDRFRGTEVFKAAVPINHAKDVKTFCSFDRDVNVLSGKGAVLAANTNQSYEQVTGYDKMGNILGLKRYGQTDAGSYGMIDNLTLAYNGN